MKANTAKKESMQSGRAIIVAEEYQFEFGREKKESICTNFETIA